MAKFGSPNAEFVTLVTRKMSHSGGRSPPQRVEELEYFDDHGEIDSAIRFTTLTGYELIQSSPRMDLLPWSRHIEDNLEDFNPSNIVSLGDILDGPFDMEIVAFPRSVETEEHVEPEIYGHPSLKGKSDGDYVLSSDSSEKKSKR